MQAKDLIGKKIGKWNVLDYAGVKNGQKYFRCLCECGNTKDVSYSNLYRGKSKSSRGYLRLKKIKDMILFFSCLAMCSCSHKNLNGIPCEALNLIYYDEIYPLEAEIEVLKNNAVIEEICR